MRIDDIDCKFQAKSAVGRLACLFLLTPIFLVGGLVSTPFIALWAMVRTLFSALAYGWLLTGTMTVKIITDNLKEKS